MKTVEKYFTVITGASAGIGEQFAIECASRKMNLFLVSLPGTGLDKLGGELVKKYGVEVITYESDLTRENETERLYKWFTEHKLKTNFLINNAGIGYAGKFEELSPEFCAKMMTLNTQVVVMMTRLFIDQLKLSPSSVILNVSSLASFSPIPYKSMYAASKAFVYSFSRALDAELRHSNIRVSVLCPGPVPTNEEVRKRIAGHEFFSGFTTRTPFQVVSNCLRGIDKRKKLIVPGLVNKLVMVLMRVVPVSLQLAIISRNI